MSREDPINLVQPPSDPEPSDTYTYGEMRRIVQIWEEQQKSLPSNVEAEMALLGAMMIDNRCVSTVAPILRAEDFYDPLNADLFDAIVRLYGKGRQANPVTLKPLFEHDPRMKRMGGVGYLAMLTGSGAALIGYRDFAQQIADLSALRKMAHSLRESAVKVCDTADDVDPGRAFAEAMGSFVQAGERADPVKMRNAKGAVQSVRSRMERIREAGSPGPRCITINDINDQIGSFEAGGYTILGGRPSMGKSVTAQSIAWGIAKTGTPAAMLSWEMTEEMQDCRLVADILFGMGEPIPFNRILKGELEMHELRALDEAEKRLAGLPLDMLSVRRQTIEAVEGHVARLVQKWESRGKKLGLVVFDYIQIIQAAKRFSAGDTKSLIEYISGRIVDMAVKYGFHALVLSQLSRQVEARTDQRPQLSDLKEAGRLEEDADNVLLAYREEYYLLRKPPKKGSEREAWELDLQACYGKCDIIAAKVRQGEVGTRQVQFFGKYQAVRGSDFIDFGGLGAEPLI